MGRQADEVHAGHGRRFVAFWVLAAAIFAACVAVCVWLWADSRQEGGSVDGTLTAYFLDVGQGDSEFVVLPDGKTMLIDAGDRDAGDDVVSYVRDTLGYRRIDYVVATHPEADHIGGMAKVLESLDVGELLVPDVSNDTATYERFLEAVSDAGMQTTPAWAGLVLDQGRGLTVEVVSPQADGVYANLNDWSVVVKVTWGATSMLFTGDVSYKVLDTLDVGHVDVLKVAHHGSNTAVSIPTLEKMGPTVAVIECGAGNDYGLPTQESLDELRYCDVQTWRTDLDGTVVVQSDGSDVRAWASLTGATTPISTP